MSGFKLRKWEKKRLKRPKITLIEVLKKDMSIKEVMESMTLDKVEW